MSTTPKQNNGTPQGQHQVNHPIDPQTWTTLSPDACQQPAIEEGLLYNFKEGNQNPVQPQIISVSGHEEEGALQSNEHLGVRSQLDSPFFGMDCLTDFLLDEAGQEAATAAPSENNNEHQYPLKEIAHTEELLDTMKHTSNIKSFLYQTVASTMVEAQMASFSSNHIEDSMNLVTDKTMHQNHPEAMESSEDHLQQIDQNMDTEELECTERADKEQASGNETINSEEVNELDVVTGERDLELLEEACRTMQSMYAKLITRPPGGFRTSLLAGRFVGVVRSLQANADEIESVMSFKPLTKDHPVLPPRSGPPYISTIEEISKEAIMDPSKSIECLKEAIGSKCGKYEPVRERFGEPGDTLLSGIKRKICVNQTCATRRHKITVRADADRVCDWIISNEADEILPRIWVHLKGGAEIKFTGLDIRARLLASNALLDVEMADALVRLLRELEAQTLFLRQNYAGRHYVGPYWGINVANGNACMDTSFNLFMYPTPRYDIRRCTIVLTLVCFKGEWSCYAFDFNRSEVAIMDPNIRHPVRRNKIDQHSDLASKMVPHVVFAMRHATGNQTMGSGTWTPKMLLGRGRAPNMQNSGIEAVNCMRWYNGNSVCTPPKDGISNNARKDLALQLISMETNDATTPVLRYALSTRPSLQARNKKKAKTVGRDHCEGSNAVSVGSTDGNSTDSP